MAELTKVCEGCGMDLPLSSFYYATNRHGNVRPRGKCKICVSRYQKEWRVKHPEHKEIVRVWLADRYKSNPERICKQNREFLKKGRDELSDYYVASILGMKLKETPLELIELKRAKLLIFRATRQLISTIKEVSNHGTK